MQCVFHLLGLTHRKRIASHNTDWNSIYLISTCRGRLNVLHLNRHSSDSIKVIFCWYYCFHIYLPLCFTPPTHTLFLSLSLSLSLSLFFSLCIYSYMYIFVCVCVFICVCINIYMCGGYMNTMSRSVPRGDFMSYVKKKKFTWKNNYYLNNSIHFAASTFVKYQ